MSLQKNLLATLVIYSFWTVVDGSGDVDREEVQRRMQLGAEELKKFGLSEVEKKMTRMEGLFRLHSSEGLKNVFHDRAKLKFGDFVFQGIDEIVLWFQTMVYKDGIDQFHFSRHLKYDEKTTNVKSSGFLIIGYGMFEYSLSAARDENYDYYLDSLQIWIP
ncbi:unnamed protein product [Caenorhabditis auriculariae]|uniref:Domain of unknown function WSN domain-containing protein n=1 Tax=Caenorhabditis auriculariae TaxID=2777116 RepID=A0A8S1GSG2_9PELO|nr:unnamed protein product [Caenorhabditis auriculariae]